MIAKSYHEVIRSDGCVRDKGCRARTARRTTVGGTTGKLWFAMQNRKEVHPYSQADLWTIANDRQRVADLGIRATHAQAPSMRVDKGATYKLDLRSTGDFGLQRME